MSHNLTRKLRKIGYERFSLVATIPSQLCEMLGWEDGDNLSFSTDGKNIILTPVSQDRQVPQEAGAASIPQGECAND